MFLIPYMVKNNIWFEKELVIIDLCHFSSFYFLRENFYNSLSLHIERGIGKNDQICFKNLPEAEVKSSVHFYSFKKQTLALLANNVTNKVCNFSIFSRFYGK